MNKFFVKNNQIEKDSIEIIGDDVNHIKNVLRLNLEEKIQVCNLDTSENYLCTIIDIQKDYIKLKIIKTIESDAELPVKITLFQGIPKFDKMELIIQKCIELGVYEIVPTKFERCVVKLNQKDEAKKIERWNKIAEVASKQSKRDIIPKVLPVISINKFESLINEFDKIIVAYEEENKNSLKSEIENIINNNMKKIAIIVGPEGGISEKEIAYLKNVGAKSCTLGKRILRTETAPITLCSILMYELDK